MERSMALLQRTKLVCRISLSFLFFSFLFFSFLFLFSHRKKCLYILRRRKELFLQRRTHLESCLLRRKTLMDIPASQHGSDGDESGWTLYLNHSSSSSFSKDHCYGYGDYYGGNNGGSRIHEDDGDEDLSMVSDASSAPRHYCEDDEDCSYGNGFFCSNVLPSATEGLAKKSSEKKKKKKKTNQEYGRNYQRHSCLDDTASSPVIGFSKKFSLSKNKASTDEHVVDFSHGFSATYFEVFPTNPRLFSQYIDVDVDIHTHTHAYV
ncbi:uncharacterized protein LOC110808436 [Carica papaya]|uniref:uncharacterized protein LOC110808436 n=1 Tax=Carica papaya TaxID=3649 RepID=UPI000B8D008A|nr:uncharacterized protein LOC110808436 [Carica papaya]